MSDKDYQYIECRDLRHSWRGGVTLFIYPVLRYKRRKSGKWMIGTHVLERRVMCSTCGTVRVESFALVKARIKAGFVVNKRINVSYRYPDHYLLEHGEKRSAEDFRLAAIHQALVNGQAHIMPDTE